MGEKPTRFPRNRPRAITRGLVLYVDNGQTVVRSNKVGRDPRSFHSDQWGGINMMRLAHHHWNTLHPHERSPWLILGTPKPSMPRDWWTANWFNRFAAVFDRGVWIVPIDNVHRVSQWIDTLGQLPGALLVRQGDLWLPLPQGQPGQVLTATDQPTGPHWATVAVPDPNPWTPEPFQITSTTVSGEPAITTANRDGTISWVRRNAAGDAATAEYTEATLPSEWNELRVVWTSQAWAPDTVRAILHLRATNDAGTDHRWLHARLAGTTARNRVLGVVNTTAYSTDPTITSTNVAETLSPITSRFIADASGARQLHSLDGETFSLLGLSALAGFTRFTQLRLSLFRNQNNDRQHGIRLFRWTVT